MKSDYQKLEEEFDKKVALLQDHTCKHKKTKWMEEWWAIGHSTGYNVLVCLNCNKKIEKKAASERRKQEEAAMKKAFQLRRELEEAKHEK